MFLHYCCLLIIRTFRFSKTTFINLDIHRLLTSIFISKSKSTHFSLKPFVLKFIMKPVRKPVVIDEMFPDGAYDGDEGAVGSTIQMMDTTNEKIAHTEFYNSKLNWFSMLLNVSFYIKQSFISINKTYLQFNN